MKLKIEFNVDNAAFENMGLECKKVLEGIAWKVACGRTYETIIDSNGNKVGRWEFN